MIQPESLLNHLVDPPALKPGPRFLQRDLVHVRSLLETSIIIIDRKLPLTIPAESCLPKAILQSLLPGG